MGFSHVDFPHAVLDMGIAHVDLLHTAFTHVSVPCKCGVLSDENSVVFV